jgi:Subtilase family
VAVLSTGVSPTQPDLAGDVITGPDYSGTGRVMAGPYWGVNGTAVASIIAGHGHGTSDDSGVMGIAPAAKILSVQVTLEYNDPLNATTAITRRLPQAIADGIVYAANHGAKVIDLPLDPGTFGLAGDSAAAGGSPAELSAVRYALAKGAVLVAPAGDNGDTMNQVNYPAAYPGVIAVGAIGHDGQLASFSSVHSYVTLTAPGVDLMTATVLPAQAAGYDPGYAPISTTAAAGGMVAGVAALIVSRYPDLPPSQVASALHKGATGAEATINAARAVQAAGLLAATIPASTVPASPKPTANPVRPHPSAHPAPVSHKAPPRPAATSTLARTVIRYVVFGVAALILLVVGLLLMTWSVRRRSRVPHPHGVREQRKGRGAAEPAEPALPGLRRVASPGSPVAAGRPAPADWPVQSEHPAASGWHSPSGFQGRGAGELAHPASTPRRPLIEPMPRPAAGHPPTSPPWAPASEPGGLGPQGPFSGPDLTEPFAGRDVLTQASLGFAAAPLPIDYPMPASPPARAVDPDEDDTD